MRRIIFLAIGMGFLMNPLLAGERNGIAEDKKLSYPLPEKLIFVVRHQYHKDHHNTATLFQKGEINESSFEPGAALIRSVKVKCISTMPPSAFRTGSHAPVVTRMMPGPMD